MLVNVNESLYGRRKSYLNAALNIIIALCVVFIGAEVIFGSIYTGIYVSGDSMLPTLVGAENEYVAGGDYVYVNTLKAPDYGDIVVVLNDKNPFDKKNIIKRVVAFGGDTVRIVSGQAEVKKKGCEEFEAITQIAAEYNTEGVRENRLYYNYPEHLVEDGCMFLLGDNRNVSADSRQAGDFKDEKLLGVVPKWSLNNVKTVTAYYTFFHFKR